MKFSGQESGWRLFGVRGVRRGFDGPGLNIRHPLTPVRRRLPRCGMLSDPPRLKACP